MKSWDLSIVYLPSTYPVLEQWTSGFKGQDSTTTSNGVFTPEQDIDKTNVEPVHSYDAFHTGPMTGMKGIIGMHRFNICLVVVVVLLWCENTISPASQEANVWSPLDQVSFSSFRWFLFFWGKLIFLGTIDLGELNLRWTLDLNKEMSCFTLTSWPS